MKAQLSCTEAFLFYLFLWPIYVPYYIFKFLWEVASGRRIWTGRRTP